jgi:hypothetical protein
MNLRPAGRIRLKIAWHLPRRRKRTPPRREDMKRYKEPGFEERASASALAKEKALERMKAAPKPDEAELAARAARGAEREARAAEKRAAREAKEEGERADREKALIAEREQARVEKPERTEAEKKDARDARYAARKNRKSGRS